MFRAAARFWGRFSKRLMEESSLLRHYIWKYRRLMAVGLVALVIVDVTEILPPFFLKQSVDVVVAGGPVRCARAYRDSLIWWSRAFRRFAATAGGCILSVRRCSADGI